MRKQTMIEKRSDEKNKYRTVTDIESGQSKKSKRVPANRQPSGSKRVAPSNPYYVFRDVESTARMDPVLLQHVINEQIACNGPSGVVYCARNTESPIEKFGVLKKMMVENEEEGSLPTRGFLLVKYVDENIRSIHKVFVRKSLDKPLIPPVIWAQRKSVVFVTIFMEDCKNSIIEIEPEQIIFHGNASLTLKVYEVTIPLFRVIEPENSKSSINGRYVEFVLQKTSSDREYWPRLTRENIKYHWLKIDFKKWEDEVDSDDDSNDDCGDNSNRDCADDSDDEGVAASNGRIAEKPPFIPPIFWAQRYLAVFVTINVEECIPLKTKFKPEKIIFYCIHGLTQKFYCLTIPLFGVIEPEKTKNKLRDKYVEIVMKKPFSDTKYWPRLTKEEKKNKSDEGESDNDSDLEAVAHCVRKIKGDAHEDYLRKTIRNIIPMFGGPEFIINDVEKDFVINYVLKMMVKSLYNFDSSEVSTNDVMNVCNDFLTELLKNIIHMSGGPEFSKSALKNEANFNNALKLMRRVLIKYWVANGCVGDLDFKNKDKVDSDDDSDDEAVRGGGMEGDANIDVIINMVKSIKHKLSDPKATISGLLKDLDANDIINVVLSTLYNCGATEISLKDLIKDNKVINILDVFNMMKSTVHKSGGPEASTSDPIKDVHEINNMLSAGLKLVDVKLNIDDQGGDSNDPSDKSSKNEEMSEFDHIDKCKETSHRNQNKKETEENTTRRSKRPKKSVKRMNL